MNLSTFYNKYKNIQVVLLSCPQFSGGNAAEPCAAPVNGGDAKIYGVELESEYHLRGLSLEATVSKQHFEYTDINPASGIPLGAPGQAFQPMKWSLAAQYELPLPTGAVEDRPEPKHEKTEKDPAAVSLGRRGGLKGGKARAAASMARRVSAAYRRLFGVPAPPAALYGYEAMRGVLDAVRRAGPAGNDRASVVGAYFHTTATRSVLGPYSIDPRGDTTATSFGGFSARDGRLTLDRVLHPAD